MNSLVLLIVCVAILGIGYVCYGGWLCKQWGVGESKTETPAHTMADGVDLYRQKLRSLWDTISHPSQAQARSPDRSVQLCSDGFR